MGNGIVRDSFSEITKIASVSIANSDRSQKETMKKEKVRAQEIEVGVLDWKW